MRCAWCNGEIGKWEVGDNPFTEHLRFFPNCLWAQLGPNVEVSSEEPISDLGIQQIRAPKKERYSSLDARIRSFANWPMTTIQSPETLATAGFYYQNTDDQVRCFQCNGGLRSWQREDDAWFEHARWFPKCEFVQLVKGKQYIEQVQRHSRPSLEEAMSSEPVQKALELGLNAGRVRAVTKYHLENFGGPFKCAETLIDAVLDYQREEERCHDDDNDDSEHTGSSSSIVREVGRILDTIFKQTRDSTTASTSSTTSPVPSTSTSLPGHGDGMTVSCARNVDTEPTIRLSDDFVDVEIPQAPATAGGATPFTPACNEVIRDEIGTTIMSSPLGTVCLTSTPSQQRQFNRKTTSTPSTSFVPENIRLTNFEVPSSTTISTTQTATTSAAATETISPSLAIQRSMESSEMEKNLSLEEENRQLRDARLCKVCMDGDVAVVFLPCGHLGKVFLSNHTLSYHHVGSKIIFHVFSRSDSTVTCVQCAPSVTACPLCRTRIKAFVRTFLS